MVPLPIAVAVGAGVIVAVACVAASARRLFFALTPMPLDLQALLLALRGEGGFSRARTLAAAIAERTDAEWEHAVFEAAGLAGEERIALINEQLQELEWRVQRWARVPRVCASIATSFALLLGVMVLRAGLLDASDVSELTPPELRDAAIRGTVTYAIDVAALGLAGATFCIAVQYRAAKAAKERTVQADKLVERLETLLGPTPQTMPDTVPDATQT